MFVRAELRARVTADGTGFEREALTAVEAAEERLLMGLRIDVGVSFEEIAALGLTPRQWRTETRTPPKTPGTKAPPAPNAKNRPRMIGAVPAK